MIKVVICDGEGTLGLGLPPPSSEIRTQIRDLLESLGSLGMKLAVASNRTKAVVQQRFRREGLQLPDFTVTPRDVGKRKPSPVFVYRIQELADVELCEMVYLGDDDRTDAFCAINAHVLPFAAQYSESDTPRRYGLPVLEPKEFGDYLSTFGRQNEPYFGWRYAATCADTNTAIDFRVLLGDHSWVTEILKGVLKDQQDLRVGPRRVSVRWLLFHYLVSQCYLSGLTAEIDWLTVYPSHKAGSTNVLLQELLETLAPAFRDKFLPDLLIRHKDAPKSQYRGAERNIFDQFRTIQLNPEYARTIEGKGVLVLDDFTTSGFSLETARRMLLQGGAEGAVCVAIAKYRRTQSKTRISKSWDPFAPCNLAQDDVGVASGYGTLNPLADEYFRERIWRYYCE